jgi:solute carrier family 10 (sodium/bile acid cotransporter), member 7
LHDNRAAATIKLMIARLFPDRFVLMLFGAILLASLMPVRGDAAGVAQGVATAAVVLLFFLNGLRLPRREVLNAAGDMRLMGAALLFCFAAMPVAGLVLSWVTAPFLPPLVALGFLYCGILPSTVQSATGATGMARGDVAASVVIAALLNLVGIALSPLLFALAGGGAVQINEGSALRIILILLLPFLAGQAAQYWLQNWATARPGLVRTLDRSAIAIAVYVAFSGAVAAGLWSRLGPVEWAVLTAGMIVLLIFGYCGAWALGGALKLPRAQRISLLFAGAQKSVAVGAPLAATLFPPAAAGMVLIALLGYHMVQLIVAAWLAAQLAEKSDGVLVE